MGKLWRLMVIVLLLIPGAIPTNTTGDASSPAMVDVLVTFYQPPGAEEISLIEGLGGTVKTVFHIVPTIADTLPENSLDALRADPRVRLVELDITLTASFTAEVLPWGVDRVDAELVHASTKGTGVKVAILDSGIDLDHPDLAVAGQVTFISGTISGDDDNGHGTLVAGIVAALDNDIGVIGVAPEASLYAVKVLDRNGSGAMSAILSGLQWAMDNSMQVINMSFGSPMGFPIAITDALDNAYNAGIVLVAGAGNGGEPTGTQNNIWSPARFESVIAVGATDQMDVRYPSSSTGYTLELVAPGVDIYSTAMGGGYGYISATSASSPHVGGVATLLIASGLANNRDVRYRLRNSALDLGEVGWDIQYGKGLANAYQALNFTEPPDKTPPTSTISLSGTKGNWGWYLSDVTLTLSVTDNVGGSGVAQTKYSLDGGLTWNPYISPLTFTTEMVSNLVLARSWDLAGNDEGPPPFVKFRIDKTPPTVTETVNPTQIDRVRKNYWVTVSYTGTAQDSGSGLSYTNNTQLIDEYGRISQNLGAPMGGQVSVEAWSEGWDRNGRTYTFRLTVPDVAGNLAFADGIATVLAPGQ